MFETLYFVDFMTFQKRLVEARKQRGLTQEALAELIGVTKGQIYRYEAGSSQPTLDVLKKLATALSVTIDELAFEKSEREPDEELKLLFEGVARLEPHEKQLIRELIEGIMLKHSAKHWMRAS